MECWCEVVELEDGEDGYFYHKQCGIQDQGIRSTAVEIDQTPSTNNTQQQQRKCQSRKQVKKPKREYNPDPIEIRNTYVKGVQIMIQLQIKALVEQFKVCPIVVDLTEHVWFRFVDSTNLFSHDWDVNAINDSESQFQGEKKAVGKSESKNCNLNGEKYETIWCRSLHNKIPLSYTLAISFLVCHLAREPILSTDITKWAHEGKLPYFAAFVEINKHTKLPRDHDGCPLTASSMFRPTHVTPVQKLEALAASIAQLIELQLPPVNFSAIASRYLKQLSLPADIILPHACRIYEWSMPPELWLSANEFMPPTHAFILSILIVSIRILYNIHGFGKWEMSLSCVYNACSSQSEVDDDSDVEPCRKDLDATEILVLLQSKYHELIDASDHAKDLEAYLEYCEKIVFAYEDQEKDMITNNLSNEKKKDDKEDEIIKDLLRFYKKKRKDQEDHSQSKTNKIKKPKVKVTLDPHESDKDREIRRMKSNMEENKFCYIPPRKRVKRHDYLHYVRKKGDGAYVYAAHADYYILLRSCARLAQLDVRSMHAAVLSFERRLGWLEKNIQHSFNLMPCYDNCNLCDLSKLIK